MAYIEDKDLKFLGDLEYSGNLNGLVEIITKDTDGKKRLTESLTSKESYKKHKSDHKKYWKDIAEEIQYFGANSIVANIRGYGVLYREIATDVADKLDVKCEKDWTIEELERAIEFKILSNSVDKMKLKEKEELVKELKLDIKGNLSTQAILVAVQALYSLGGALSYQITLIITRSILQGIGYSALGAVGGIAAGRAIGALAGPVGLVITGLWTLIDLTGPAYRVTIPAVIQVSMLRTLYKQQKEELAEKIRKEMEELNK